MENKEPQVWDKPSAPPMDVPAGMNAVWNGTSWQFVPNPVYKAPE